MGLDISTMSEEQLRAYRNELQERRVSPALRRSATKKDAKMTKAIGEKQLVDLDSLLNL